MELYQDRPLKIPTKELNDMDSYRRLEEVRRCSNKELTVTRKLLEGIRSLKEYATLGKRKSFQHVSASRGWLHSLTKKRLSASSNPQFLGGKSARNGESNVRTVTVGSDPGGTSD